MHLIVLRFSPPHKRDSFIAKDSRKMGGSLSRPRKYLTPIPAILYSYKNQNGEKKWSTAIISGQELPNKFPSLDRVQNRVRVYYL